MDAVVISIPQMDSISVAFMERDFYRKKIQANKYRFDLLVLDIEQLEETLRFKEFVITSQESIISEKTLQIKTLEEQRALEQLSKPTFINKVGKYGLVAFIGFLVGVLLTL